MADLHVLAGPNGSGKSSYVSRVLGSETGLPFINADEIAAERWPGDTVGHSYEAARIAETQRRERMAAGDSFITETVFSHPSKVSLIKDAVARRYSVHLYVLLIPPSLAVQRVEERVHRGGHGVPEDKIFARYERLWTHVAEARRIADDTTILDNSLAARPFRVVATYRFGELTGPTSYPRWTPQALLT